VTAERLAGEVVVVTGGAQGIGRAAVGTAIREGAKVGFLDLDDDKAREVVASYEAAGVRLGYRHADVAVEAQVVVAMAELAGELGRVDVLVNNAGRNSFGDSVTMTFEE
jgi:NAD(P)-dependent dehydrogenase (short-subunit alcohol dehydrogenase family)